MKFSVAGILIGGYEHEERQPNPFVAMDFLDHEDAMNAETWLKKQKDDGVMIQIGSVSEEDLSVQIIKADSGEILCEGEVWKDEMWQIFLSYFRQMGQVLLMVSVGGVVRSECIMKLSGKFLRIME
ncbi:hypothetical protein GXN76_11965 [Kroppenstedtia pulmonis]|uniref:Uncharacterized protein n=1 Tax=Kroppenstedtia pulmonis TaxID=1380685 RepID=A0A7D4BKW8_9BACL|nr:hypothetical protein [Kroppenstedtia pulmonis]QKG85110.1 hypothetical protein GXN76_11965 [Kroppenstedtia pulmonis]